VRVLRDCLVDLHWPSLFASPASYLTIGAALAISNGSPAAAQVYKGKITFTADNAAEIFFNGKSLGQTNNWRLPFEFDVDDLELKQGENVIGIAAWDQEGIAGMSGRFVMPDGTEFGTTNFEQWLVYPADKETKVGNKSGNPYSANTINPLEVYAQYLDIPDNWNTADFDLTKDFAGKEWTIPGFVIEGEATSDQRFPWGKGTTGDSHWLWLGKNTKDKGNVHEETGDWYKHNFLLFRYTFICRLEFCNDDVGWSEMKVIDEKRDWNDIYSVDNFYYEDGKTYPIFQGGTLSFIGFEGAEEEYMPNFYLDDFPGNTIDNAGFDPKFTGVLSGPGGMKFSGSGTTTLTGFNSYSGATTIANGTTLKVTGTLSDQTAVNVEEGGTYEVESSDQVGSIEGAGKIRIAKRRMLAAGILHTDTEFSGEISGDGSFKKKGRGMTILSGENSYEGKTVITNGILKVSGALSDLTAVNVRQKWYLSSGIN
jgi:autotransporter-associated beta strand protein